ncbi:MAG: hypothetical protein ACRDT2_16515 [Natronosporangium sp.]
MTSTVASYACLLDRVPEDRAVSPERVDLAPILGGWSNTNLSTWGISRAELVQQDGGVALHIVAADPVAEPHDWGRVPVDRVFTDGPGSNHACGYTAAFDLGHARTRIQGNTSHGLSVIAASTVFTDGSGRLSYLSREFYDRRPAPTTPARAVAGGTTGPTGLAVARGDDRLPMLADAGIDPAPLLCRWRNTDESPSGIAEIRCELRDGRLTVRVVAVGPDGPIDWGEAPATVYTDLSSTGGGRAAADPVTDGRPTPHYADISTTDSGPAFEVTYDHGFQLVRLQARSYLGVLVVPVFTEFTDGRGRADYYRREVFVRGD